MDDRLKCARRRKPARILPTYLWFMLTCATILVTSYIVGQKKKQKGNRQDVVSAAMRDHSTFEKKRVAEAKARQDIDDEFKDEIDKLGMVRGNARRSTNPNVPDKRLAEARRRHQCPSRARCAAEVFFIFIKYYKC